MRTIVFAVAASGAMLTSAPLLAGAASPASVQLAQVDVDVRVGPPAVRIEEERRPVVIEGTDGRRRDCVTRSESETRNGVTVTERERDCR
jgi:hypothetical protein